MVGGRVRDLVTLRPISGAEVSGAGRTVRTDDRGRFELHVPPGEHDLTARAAGHTAATAVGQAVSALPVRVDFELPPIQADHAAMAAAAVRVRSGGARAAVTADEPSGGAVQVVSAQAVVDVPATIRVLMPDGEIVEMDTDEYLKGVVPAEMGYVFARALEALKAQAIASRTYAARTCLPDSAGDPDVCEPGLDANVDTTTRTQVWRPTHYEVSDAAVVATHGQVVRYGGELVPALFFARARLRTLSSEDSPCCGGAVWPFLRSVASPDPFAARRGHGAGMSQEGAATLADWGADADEIVTYYYTSTTVDPPQPTPSATAATTSASIAGADGSAAAAGAAEGLGAAARAGDTTGSATRAISAARAGSATLGAADFGAAPSTDTGVSDAGSTDDVRGASVDSTVIEADFPFMALAGQWSELAEGVPEVSVSVRTSRDGVRWSEWSELEPDVDMKEPPRGGEVWSRLHVARGTFAQLRLTTLGADSLDSATVPDRLTLHYLDTDAGPTAPRLGTQSTRQTLTVIPRAGWGADESLRFGPSGEVWPPEYTKPLAEIVHHTVTANDPVDPAAIVRSIYYYHAVTRGWGDIGYNFLVDHRGNVYEGRFGGESGDRIVQGGHALQYNVNTIGVAVLGTFTEADQQPRAESLDGLVTVLAHKARRFGIEPFAPVNLAGTGFDYSILGHRDVLPGHTVCPGDGLHELLPQIRTSVDRLIDELSDPGASTDPPPSDTPTSRPPTATRRPPSATPAPPSATPAPPTVTSPPPAGCVEMVADGGFEDGSAAWMRSGAYHTSWDAHSGDWAMFVGLRNNDPDEGASAAAWQDVDGPFGDLGGGSARLAFALRTQAFAGDRLVAHVLDEDGAAVALQTFEPPLSSDWTEYSFDITRELAAAAPGALRLHFAVSNNGDGQRSYMRVDDVSLLVCGTPPPPPQSPAAPSPTPIAATSTPPATAPSTPGAVRCGTLLRDGGFESDGLVTWQLSGDNPARRSTESPHSGDGALVLGLGADDGDDFGYSAAAQLVTFPASTVSARLTLWARRLSTSPEDAFVVELRRTTDGRLERLLGPTLQGAPGGWSSQTVALDPADLDGTVEVYLAVLNRGQRDTSGRTAIAIDDVVLEVCFNAAVASRYVPRAVTAHP